ncbi:hypothetical protein ACYOEI_28070 [Singulisphaera rosea]
MSAQMNAIIRDLEQVPHIFDFDRDGFGEEVAEATAAAIFEYMDAETSPDGGQWIDLAPAYQAWKERHYPGRKMGELELKMKDPMQLRGEPNITPNELVQEYGTDEDAKLEAEWFQEGNEEQNRPPRKFYALNDLALHDLGNLFDRRFQTIR